MPSVQSGRHQHAVHVFAKNKINKRKCMLQEPNQPAKSVHEYSFPVLVRQRRQLHAATTSSKACTTVRLIEEQHDCRDWLCERRRRQAHLLVVVEHDNHVLVKEASMIHGLVGHAPSDGTITDHSHTVIFPTLQVKRLGVMTAQTTELLRCLA